MNRIKDLRKITKEDYYPNYGGRFCHSESVSRIANLERLIPIRTSRHQLHTTESTIANSQVQLVGFPLALDYYNKNGNSFNQSRWMLSDPAPSIGWSSRIVLPSAMRTVTYPEYISG